MDSIKILLDRCKDATGAKNENQLASRTGIKSQRISDYYKGTRTPDEYACLRIAQVLGRPFEEVTAIVRIEAEKDESRRAVWREYYKSIGGYAASILAGLAVTFIVTLPSEALANQSVKGTDYAGRQIMRLWRSLRKAIEAAQRRLAMLVPRAYCPD